MIIVADDSTRGHAGQNSADAVERALAAAILDPSRLEDLLDELRRGRLWVPLPDGSRPVTDGSAVRLPTVTHRGAVFVPAFTSAARWHATIPRPRPPAPSGPGPESYAPPPVRPHIVVPAAALARLLPPDVGIALNPGGGPSIPLYPQDVAYLARAGVPGPGGRISVGPPPVRPDELLDRIRSGLTAVPAAARAYAAWLSVEQVGQGLVISVTLDDPADREARDAVIRVVERAARTAPPDPWFPIDVTFPGEGPPDPVDEWVATRAAPFYRRAGSPA
jgi:SseB protein N-terminal domain/SseB protein C-terminal domain